MNFSWLVRFLRIFGRDPVVHWLFAAMVLGSAGFGLADVVRGFPVGQAFQLAMIAVPAGWLLGRSRRLAIWLAPVFVLSGWFAALIQQIDIAPGLLAWLRAAYAVLGAVLRRQEEAPIDLSPLLLAGNEITTVLSQAQERLSTWFYAWQRGSAAYDQVAVGLVWSCGFWILGIWAGWSFRRWSKPMVSVLPAGLLLVGSLNYASGNARYLLPFTGFLIGWMAVHTYQEAHRHWQTDRIDYAEDIGMDFSLATGAIIVLLLLVGLAAASFPVISVQAAVEWAQEVFNPGGGSEEAVAESFGLKRDNPPTYFQQLSAGELPRKHLIGSGPDLSQRVVMTVQVLQPEAGIKNDTQDTGWRYYWRSLTYDEYTGLGWQSSQAEEQRLQAGSMLHAQEFASQQIVEQQIRLVEKIGPSIYAAGELLTIDATFTAAFRPINSSSTAPDARLDLFGASASETTYRVLSVVPGADIATLRNAGSRYPDWIAQRYLTLPQGVPMRVLTLASELTRGAPTPFDRIQLIENYLRDFPYTLDLPAPPADRDIVDYFLFDLKKGYCDYYATTMVVMARAIGVPARLAMGYASGSYDPVNKRYLVSEADAHSWAEVYFPGHGWVEFEPTGGLPQAQRPTQSAFQNPSDVSPEMLADFQQPFTLRLLNSWVFWLAVAVVIILVGWLIYTNIRMSRLPPGESIILTYRRFHHQVQPLTGPPPTSHTPLELAFQLEQWFTTRKNLLRRFPGLKRISVLARRLTDLYMEVVYGPRTPGIDGQNEAKKLWRMLKLPLHLSRFAGKLMPSEGVQHGRSNDDPPPGSGVF